MAPEFFLPSAALVELAALHRTQRGGASMVPRRAALPAECSTPTKKGKGVRKHKGGGHHHRSLSYETIPNLPNAPVTISVGPSGDILITSGRSIEAPPAGNDGALQPSSLAPKRIGKPPPSRSLPVLEVTVACDVDALFDSFGGSLWARFLRERNHENVHVGPWEETSAGRVEEGGEDGCVALRKRSVHFDMTFSLPFVRGKHRTYDAHALVFEDPGRAYVVESTACVPSLPVGRCVTTAIQWHFAADEEDATRTVVTASYDVIFDKKTAMKGVIERSSASGINETMRDFEAFLARSYGVIADEGSLRK